MSVDVIEIIKNTKDVFQRSSEIKSKIDKLENFLDHNEYQTLHPFPLTPTSIVIDKDSFELEIKKYESWFEQWGEHHSHLPRYGLALVNTDGILKKNDPINGSLYEWNAHRPDDPIIETDCTYPTEVMQLSSLHPLSVFGRFWLRSNILKWQKTAEFKPHIDTILPSPWIRLWGTTNPDIEINFYGENGIIPLTSKIEAGRIYIIDTSLVHDAKLNEGIAYQFFLCVSPQAKDIVKEMIDNV